MNTLPQEYEFGSLEWLSNKVVEGFITGFHKSPFQGFSVEFAEHRIYNQGESTRHIDWKLYARTDRLYVKKYEEETNLRCQLVIDTSGSMYYPWHEGRIHPNQPSKIQFSLFAAAALIQLFRKQRDGFGLSLFDSALHFHSHNSNTPAHQKFLFDQLEKQIKSSIQIGNTQSKAPETLHQLAETLKRRSLVFIFSDLMLPPNQTEEMIHALQHLKYNKHQVVLFHTVEPKTELELNFEGNRPVILVDIETGKELKLLPAEAREYYKQQLDKTLNKIIYACVDYGIEYVKADINQGYHAVMLNYLLRKNR